MLERTPEWSSAVRNLNDAWRCYGQGRGRVVLSDAIKNRGETFVQRAMTAIKQFDNFNRKFDFWGEHDFGRIQIDDETLVWRFDYLDENGALLSEDPTDTHKTTRQLRVLLASEC